MTGLMMERRRFLTSMLSAFGAPAIVCIDNIMPVRAIALPVEFDSFNGLAPEGSTYQWVSETILGQPDPHYQNMIKAGWKAVRASRHPQFEDKYGQFVCVGCILMERPTKRVHTSHSDAMTKALELVERWKSHWTNEGFTVDIHTSIVTPEFRTITTWDRG